MNETPFDLAPSASLRLTASPEPLAKSPRPNESFAQLQHLRAHALFAQSAVFP
jgi:hypothetical protein